MSSLSALPDGTIPSGNDPAERKLLRVFGRGAFMESVTSGRDLLYPEIEL